MATEFESQYDATGPVLRFDGWSSTRAVISNDVFEEAGYVTNISDKYLEQVEIQFMTYDADGARLGTPTGSIVMLAPGEKWKFNISVNNADATGELVFCRFVYLTRLYQG